MKQIFTIWMQPIYARVNTDGKKTLLPLLFLFPLLGLAIAYILPADVQQKMATNGLELPLIATGFAVDIILFFATWYLILPISAGQQMSAANAALVPHLKRKLQIAISIPMLIVTSVVGLLVYDAGGVGYGVGAWALTLTALLIHVSTTREKWIGYAIGLLGLLTIAAKKIGLDSLLYQLHLHLVLPQKLSQAIKQPIFLIPLGLLATWIVIRWTFSRGDHLFERQRYLTPTQVLQLNGDQSIFNTTWTRKIFASVYMFCFERDIKRNANQCDLLPFVFSPRTHFGSGLMGLLSIIAMISMWSYLFNEHGSSGANEASMERLVTLTGLVFYMGAYYIRLQLDLYSAKAPLALLSLAAKGATYQKQNEVLVRHIVSQYVLLWTSVMVIVNAYTLFARSEEVAKNLALLIVTCALIPAIFLIKNYGQMKAASDNDFPVAFSSSLVAFFIALAISIFTFVTVLQMSALVFFGVSLLMQWRWKKLMQAGPMFPAGRAS